MSLIELLLIPGIDDSERYKKMRMKSQKRMKESVLRLRIGNALMAIKGKEDN